MTAPTPQPAHDTAHDPAARRVMIATLVLLVAVIAALVAWQPGRPDRGSPPGDGRNLDFTLQSADGPVRLADYRGQVVVVYFGYTFCPDVCPTSLATLGAALESLTPAEQARVQPLFISVDPARDTPEQLKSYSRFFHPRLRGLTGSPEAIAEVAKRYGVYYAVQKPAAPAAAPAPGNGRSEDAGYSVDHTSVLYLIGSDGKLAAQLPHGTPPDAVAAALRRLIPAAS